MINYEKEYNEALERAKKLKETCDSTAVIGWCEYLFPSLKESEGERIKREIIEYIKTSSYQYHKDWIAWLEKQGEQKPADKVESKFKIGDWIVYNRTDHSREVMQIYDIRDNRYYFNDNIHFSWSVKECDEKSHLWSIKEAREGDVLAEDSCIFIIQKLCGITAAKIYCTLFNDGDFEDGSTLYFDIDSTKPATKEQCDTLERAMTNAGYRWNKEELKLEKI